MRTEILAASNFLTQFLGTYYPVPLCSRKLRHFRNSLMNLCHLKFANHWDVEQPYKGSVYRHIRIERRLDPLIVKAANVCGLKLNWVNASYPAHVVVWIDPNCVRYRIGSEGSFQSLYDAEKKETHQAWLHKDWNLSASLSTENLNNQFEDCSLDVFRQMPLKYMYQYRFREL